MRESFSDIIEAGRVRKGPMASARRAIHGAFRVFHPKTNRQLNIIASPHGGWDHVSVSNPNSPPSWDEMCWVKSEFFKDTEWVVQYHPSASAYVNHHANCLHLWRPTQEDDLVKPPVVMV